MKLQFLRLTLVLIAAQSTAFAQKDNKIVSANPNDIIAPVVMKTSNPEEVNVGAFSFTPNDQFDPKAISKLRAELLKMEKEALASSKNNANNNFNFVNVGTSTGQMLDLLALQNLESSIQNKRLEILNQTRLESIKKQNEIYKTAQTQEAKIKAEIALMELKLDINFLREVVAARKNGTRMSDEALLVYTNAVKKLSLEAKSTYIKALSDKSGKQLENFNPIKFKLYLSMLEKIDNFQALRQEENAREIQDQSRNKTNKEVFVSTTKRFAPETFAFFVASGAVTFNAMWIKSHGDPMEMERHIMSLKDPIAHISFYAFMQANGLFTNFHTSKASFQALDASTKRQMMVKLSYAGMAVGSFASSIVSDLGSAIVTCSDKWMQGKKDDVSLQSCDQAMKQWTLRKKTNQYFPQIIALFASQAATEMVENNAFRAFERMGVKSFSEKYLTRKAMTSLAYRISAADVVMTCIPYAGEAKWISKGLKFVGTVTKLSAFVAVDHVLSSYVNRPISNILKPAFFTGKNTPNLNAAWLTADQINWDETQAQKTSRPKTIDEKVTSNFMVLPSPAGINVIPFKQPGVSIKNSFPEDIESYTEEMQAWRSHLNESADADLAGWEEMTKKLLNQVDFSFQFYKKFTNELFTSLNTQSEVSKGQLNASALANISNYPLNRSLPFYGVSPGPLSKESAAKFNDYYLSSPDEVEKLQRATILNAALKYINLKIVFTNTNENKIYSDILSKLNSGKTIVMTQGLSVLRKAYNDVQSANAPTYSSASTMAPISASSGPRFDVAFQKTIKNLFLEIGNPMPILDPLASFSQSVAGHSVFKGMDELAGFSNWSIRKKYQFNKVTDLMMFKMICGDQKSALDQVQLAGVNFLTPEFKPPTLLKSNSDRKDFCNSIKNSSNLYYNKIGNESLSSYFLKNLNVAAIGDYTKAQDPETFEKWWITNAKKPIEQEFKGYDRLYRQAYEKAYDNFIGDGTWYENLVDNLNTSSEYLPNTIQNSLKTESNVYLQLINRALIQKDVQVRAENPKRGFKVGSIMMFSNVPAQLEKNPKTDYLLQANAKIKKAEFDSIYSAYRPEVSKLYSLLNNYLSFVENYRKSVPELKNIIKDNTLVAMNKPMLALKIEQKEQSAKNNANIEADKKYRLDRFNQYIENSKKIDAAINDILVSAGLKKLVKRAAALTEDQIAANAFAELSASVTGTETTEDVYEDLKVSNPTLRQKVIISAVKGIRQVESETRRFIRMNTLLSNRLFVENQEILTQIGNN